MAGDYLVHWGKKGQKWGVRRYQNTDGSLTPEGYEHYGITPPWERRQKDFKNYMRDHANDTDENGNKLTNEQIKKNFRDAYKPWYDVETGQLTEDTRQEDYKLITQKNANMAVLNKYDNLTKGPNRSQQAQALTSSIQTGTRATSDLLRSMEKRSVDELPNGTKKSGYEKTMEALAVIGGIASVTGAVIGIAAAIKDLRDD